MRQRASEASDWVRQRVNEAVISEAVISEWGRQRVSDVVITEAASEGGSD